MSLYRSSELKAWTDAFQKRDEFVRRKELKAIESLRKSKRKNKEQLIENMKLVEFDRFLFGELHQTLRDRGHITLDELSTAMKWKLFRGQFRPRLQALIEGNKKAEVIKHSETAFRAVAQCLDDQGTNIQDTDALKLSIKELSKLKGVGVATASLVLAIYSKVVPFMADESMLAVSPGTKLKYDIKSYLNYTDKLVAKCNALAADKENGAESKSEDLDTFKVTPFVLGECLWTDHMVQKLGGGDSKDTDSDSKGKSAGKKNRKRKARDDGGDDVDDAADTKPTRKRQKI